MLSRALAVSLGALKRRGCRSLGRCVFPDPIHGGLDLVWRDHVQALYSKGARLAEPAGSTVDRAIEINIPGIAGRGRVDVPSVDHDCRRPDGSRNVHRARVRRNKDISRRDCGDKLGKRGLAPQVEVAAIGTLRGLGGRR